MSIPTTTERMTPAEFKARHNFILSDHQEETLERAEIDDFGIIAVIGHALGRSYLLELDIDEERRAKA